MSQYVKVQLQPQPEGRRATHTTIYHGKGALECAPVGGSIRWIPWSQIKKTRNLKKVEAGTDDVIYVTKWFCDKHIVPYEK